MIHKLLTVVGIDPGLDTGYAVIYNGRLELAGLSNLPFYHDPTHVFIECPRIYPTGTPNPNDLIKLAVRVGEYKKWYDMMSHAKVALVAPSDWKAQLPKAVTKQRVRVRFPDLDRWLVGVPKGKHHNVYDAIGIAAYGWDKELKRGA